jgi:hypothetical protein
MNKSYTNSKDETEDLEVLNDALTKYINYIVEYKESKQPKIIESISILLDRHPDFSSPPPFEELPLLTLPDISGIETSKIYSFISATIYTTKDDILLQLYLLKLLYYKHNISRRVETNRIESKSSVYSTYKNDPSKNKVCIYDYRQMFSQYQTFTDEKTRSFDQEMFIKFYDSVYKSAKRSL